MTREPIRGDVTKGAPSQKPTRKRKGGTSRDPLHIDASAIPVGTSYEWKRKTYLGIHDETHQLDLRENGWTPVPSARHPDRTLSPSATRPIEYKGMILMERPMELTEEARAEDDMNARRQVRDKEVELGKTPAGTLERTQQTIRKSYEPAEIPEI